MIETALEYVKRGWAVIPLHPRGKRPMIASWREFQNARPDEGHVRGWWTACPDANIAVLTGRISGLVVVDYDNFHGDPEEFLSAHHMGAEVPIVHTSKGFHCYYRHPGGEVQNGVRVGRVGDTTIDVRGDGGYVVAPPSIHESGVQYEWYREAELSLLPETFRRVSVPGGADSFRPAPATASDFVRAVTEVDALLRGVGEGGRNDAAAKVCGYYLGQCRDELAAWRAVEGWNKLNTPPLPDSELATVFQSIARRERSNTSRSADALIPAVQDPGKLKLLSGREWADAVRDVPPRLGLPAPSWPGLEEVGGIVSKDLLILAGRPGTGKSTCACGVIVDQCLERGQPTIFFSTEMTMADVARWIGGFIYRNPGRLSGEQWTGILDRISRSPVTICDAGAVSVRDIDAIVRNRPETKLVIVDHMQRLQWGGESRNQAIEAGAAMLKSLAKDADCTVMLLSQLNRGSAHDKRRPGLHDLRDSGGLEQEADAVCFIWTEAEDITVVDLPVKFWWAKNRHGALAEVNATFHKGIKRFVPANLADKIAQQVQQAEFTQHLNHLLEVFE